MPWGCDSTARDPTLDPLALPPETDSRFLLFIAAAALLASNAGWLLGSAVLPQSFYDVPDLETDPDAEPGAYFASAREQAVRSSLRTLALLGPPLTVLAVVLVAAWARYRSHPRRLARRWSLSGADSAGRRAAADRVAQVAREAGVAPPRVLFTPGGGHAAQAFGTGGGATLRLDRGLVAVARVAPGAFDAIVRHELAHLSSGDVRRSYFATALWWATRWFAVAPYVAALLLLFVRARVAGFAKGGPRGALPSVEALAEVAFLSVGLAGMTWLVAVSHASLLRRREHYADWLSARGGEAAVLRLFEGPAAAAGRRPWWRRLLAAHPDARERAGMVREPVRFFWTSWEVPLVVGALMGLVVVGLIDVVLPASIALMGSILAVSAAVGTYAVAAGSPAFAVFGFLLAAGAGLASLVVVVVPALAAGWLVARSLVLAAARGGVARALVAARGGLGVVSTVALVAAGLELGFALSPLGILSPVRAILPGEAGPDAREWSVWFAAALLLFGVLLAAGRLTGSHRIARRDAPATRRGVRLAVATWSVAAGTALVALGAGRLRVMVVGAGPEGDLLFSAAVATGVVSLLASGVAVTAAAGRSRCAACRAPLRGGRCSHCGHVTAQWLTLPAPALGDDGPPAPAPAASWVPT